MNGQATEREINRVFIADPSFQDWVGHHAPYDLSIQAAVREAGGKAEIWANRVIAIPETDDNGDVKKVFSRTSWGVVTSRSEVTYLPYRLLLGFGLVLAATGFALLYVARSLASAVRRCAKAAAAFLKTDILPRPSPTKSGLRKSVGRLARWALEWWIPPFVRHPWRSFKTFLATVVPPYFFHLWRSFKAAVPSLVPPFLRHPRNSLKTVLKILVPPFFPRMVRAFRPTLREITPPHWVMWLLALPYLTEYYELRQELRRRKFGPGDLLFAHMLTGRCLPVWALLASWLSKGGKKGELTLLFRYSLYFMVDNGGRSKLCWRAIESAFLKGRLKGATDSSLLAREYAQTLAVPLVVYPIPHVPETVSSPPAWNGRKPLRCVSLGNARDEKGIVEIFDAIRLLNKHGYGDRFSFGLQVNNPDTPATAGAIAAMAGDAWPNVELFHEPLSPREYDDLLAGADIVLVPYWSSVYFARTSGVFLEGLTAGKILVTTRDTWMECEAARFGAACELVPSGDGPAIADALARIAADRHRYAGKAVIAAKKAREFHNPGSFARHLLHAPFQSPVKFGDEVLICFPFWNFLAGQSGNSTRVAYLLRVLKDYRSTVFTPEGQLPGQGPNLRGEASYKLFEYGDSPETYFGWFVDFVAGLFFVAWDFADSYFVPMFLKRRRDRGFRLELLRAMQDKKAVFVEYPFHVKRIAPYARALGLPVVLTAHDRHAPVCANFLRRRLIDRWEKDAARLADLVITVAKGESDYFRAAGIDNILAPSTFDISMTHRGDAEEVIVRETGRHLSDPFFLFVGSQHDPNYVAKDHICELAKQARKAGLPWEFVIAGGCGIGSVTDGKFIVLGKVSDDLLAALYAKCRLVLSPLFAGTGASVKTVEAFGMGKVVFGAAATFRGLAVTDGVECFIEDDLEEYLPRLRTLLESPGADAVFGRVASNARKFAASYDFRVALKPYRDFLEAWPAGRISTVSRGPADIEKDDPCSSA